MQKVARSRMARDSRAGREMEPGTRRWDAKGKMENGPMSTGANSARQAGSGEASCPKKIANTPNRKFQIGRMGSFLPK